MVINRVTNGKGGAGLLSQHGCEAPAKLIPGERPVVGDLDGQAAVTVFRT